MRQQRFPQVEGGHLPVRLVVQDEIKTMFRRFLTAGFSGLEDM